MCRSFFVSANKNINPNDVRGAPKGAASRRRRKGVYHGSSRSINHGYITRHLQCRAVHKIYRARQGQTTCDFVGYLDGSARPDGYRVMATASAIQRSAVRSIDGRVPHHYLARTSPCTIFAHAPGTLHHVRRRHRYRTLAAVR